MSLQHVLQTAKITCAHIIDDAFDALPTEAFQGGVAQTLIDNLSEDHFDEVIALLGCKNEAELLQALQELEQVQQLYKSRRTLTPHCDGWFDDFLNDRSEKKAKVRPLISLLRKNGVRCVTYGADYRLHRHSIEPQLVFIDLRLVNEGQTNANASIQVYKKLKHQFKECVPFVFLMSSLDALGEFRDTFWKEAGVFLTQFDAVKKDLFQDKAELASILGSYSTALPQIRMLHQHVEQLENAISTAGRRVRETVRSLDVADYFVLHRNTVAAEKSDLGTYVSELLLEYALFEIEGSSEVWQFAKDLEGWELKDLPRSRFSLKPAAMEIYKGNLIHANARLTWETVRNKGPQQGYFHLGDIFLNSAEITDPQATPKSALVLLTPACDLARPEDLNTRSMFLCEGKVEKVKPTSVLIADDALPKAILTHPNNPDEQLLIEWNRKKVKVWDSATIKAFETNTSLWAQVGRLKPIYAFQLQHAVMTNMTRIGTQRAPDLLIPHGIEVLIAKGNKWHALDSVSLKEPSAAAISPRGDGSKILYLIDDAIIGRVRRTLDKWIKDNRTEPASAVLKEIRKLPAWSQKLLYCDHLLPKKKEERTPVSKDALPISDLPGIQDPHKGAVIITTSTHKSPYSSITGGTARDPATQPALLVFKLIRQK